MSKKIIMCLLSALVLLAAAAALNFTSSAVDAEMSNDIESGRNIYVGDIIRLKVTTLAFSAEELERMFQDFEIVEIKDEPEGYLLSVRTFTVGEQKIQLGDNEIVINVSSTLNDIQRDSIFEGDEWVIKPGFQYHWRILFFVTAGVFALSGGFMLAKIIKKRKAKQLDPLQTFIKRSDALSAYDDYSDNYFVDLTFYFKEYLEALYTRRIIGKTSDEIINMLKEIQALDAMLPEIMEWLAECDRIKFTGAKVSGEVKTERYAVLRDLAERIGGLPEEEAA
ncbi:MAG: hypothetical protein LBH28_03545 [Oscillospiraceae bacterium]|nr:hypothetical protein [Oscillospiraceae bacterium]